MQNISKLQKRSIKYLYDVLAFLYAGEKENKDVIQNTKVSKSYLSQLIKKRSDLIEVRNLILIPSRTDSRLVLRLKLEEYINHIFDDLDFVESERKQMLSIIEDHRQETGEKLWNEKENIVKDFYLFQDLFLEDPLIFILMNSPMMTNNQMFQTIIWKAFYKKISSTKFISTLEKMLQNKDILNFIRVSGITEALAEFSIDLMRGEKHNETIKATLKINDREEMKRVIKNPKDMEIFDNLLSYYINDYEVRKLLINIRDAIKSSKKRGFVIITHDPEDDKIKNILIGEKGAELLKNFKEITLRKHYAGDISNENKLRIAVGKFIDLWVNNPNFQELFYKLIPFTEMEPQSNYVILQAIPSKKSIEPYYIGTGAKNTLKIYNSLIVNDYLEKNKE